MSQPDPFPTPRPFSVKLTVILMWAGVVTAGFNMLVTELFAQMNDRQVPIGWIGSAVLFLGYVVSVIWLMSQITRRLGWVRIALTLFWLVTLAGSFSFASLLTALDLFIRIAMLFAIWAPSFGKYLRAR